MKNKQELIANLVRLPSQGRRIEEIAQELRVSADKVEALLKDKPRMPEGFQLVSWKNNIGMTYWQVLKPEPEPVKVQPRAFRYVRAEHEAYHRVFIPDGIVDENGRPAKYIELFPFSDVHWGHRECDKATLINDVEEVRRRPNRFAFLNGDNIENSLGNSAKGSAWAEQDATPEEQVEQSKHVYRCIAHKIVVARKGNHEARSMQNGSGMDPLKIICDSLGGIPYFPGPSNMEIIWQGYRWTFHMKHGTGASNTAGGKINAVGRDRNYNDFRNFYVMGHVHDELVSKAVRSVRRRVYDADGNPEFWVEHLKEYLVICPSYLKYSRTYAEEAGYSPGSRSSLVIQLFNNGDYHVVSRKRGQEGSELIH